MSELTPRNNFPFPSEREEPFYDTFKAGELAKDASIFANADNSNIQFVGGGVFSWDASNDLLFWTEDVFVSGFHTAFGGTIPTGSILIQEDEVVYFEMPRLVQTQNATLQLFRSSRIFLEGTRLNDLRLFVVRKGDTLYFYNGLSLQDGDTGVLFGQGLLPLQTVLPHEHLPAFLYIAPAAGIFTITPTPIETAPDLVRMDVYRNGQLQVEGATEDYTVDLNTGIITLNVPTVVVPNPDKFVVWREVRDTTVTVTSHQHASKLVLSPTPGTAVLSALASSPFLLRVDLFRNGMLQTEGATEDYTVDLVTGLITLSTPSVFGDKFEIFRELGIP